MQQINHYGTVTNVKKGSVQVRITSYSACHNCDARHGCGLMDCQNKMIEIATIHASEYQKGEEVIVSLAQNSGLWAVVLGYVLPLIFLKDVGLYVVTGYTFFTGLVPPSLIHLFECLNPNRLGFLLSAFLAFNLMMIVCYVIDVLGKGYRK